MNRGSIAYIYNRQLLGKQLIDYKNGRGFEQRKVRNSKHVC